MRRKSKSETAKLRDKCDELLTPIVKLKTPYCESCGQPTQVAHHWIEKSRSSRLRYEIDNLIALCHPCHTRIHNRFGGNILGAVDIVEQIRHQRGEEWYNRMQKLSREIIKTNKEWYEKQTENCEKILSDLRKETEN